MYDSFFVSSFRKRPLALRRTSLISDCRPAVVFFHPCNITLRQVVRHSNQCRSDLLAFRILLDPQQWTIIHVFIALSQVTKCIRSVVHDGVDVVATLLVHLAPLLWIVAQAVVLDEGDAIELVLPGEIEVFAEPSLGFGGGMSFAHCAAECIGVAFDVVAVEAHVLITHGDGQ